MTYAQPALVALLLFISIWDLCWKGKALWKAAQRKHLGWFVVLLIVNSIGILPIVYLGLFSKKK